MTLTVETTQKNAHIFPSQLKTTLESLTNNKVQIQYW